MMNNTTTTKSNMLTAEDITTMFSLVVMGDTEKFNKYIDELGCTAPLFVDIPSDIEDDDIYI